MRRVLAQHRAVPGPAVRVDGSGGLPQPPPLTPYLGDQPERGSRARAVREMGTQVTSQRLSVILPDRLAEPASGRRMYPEIQTTAANGKP
jgi:hypothetical protein